MHTVGLPPGMHFGRILAARRVESKEPDPRRIALFLFLCGLAAKMQLPDKVLACHGATSSRGSHCACHQPRAPADV